MLDKNVENNRTKLLKEISDVKDRLSLFEELADDNLIGLPDIEQLSDDQVQSICFKLRIVGDLITNAKDFLIMYAKRASGGDKNAE